MKKCVGRLGSAALALVIASSSMSFSVYANINGYSDIRGHWSEEIVTRWQNEDIVSGYPDGTFKPDELISRAEFAAWVARLFGYAAEKETPGTEAFVDIGGHWAEDVVKALTANGVIVANEYDGKFMPNQHITRIEMIRMMVRAIGKDSLVSSSSGIVPFNDALEVGRMDSGFINVAADNGIIAGYPDGTLKPYQTATRAEAAAMLVKLKNHTEIAEEKTPLEEKAPILEETKIVSTPEPVKSTTKPSGGSGGGGSRRPSSSSSVETTPSGPKHEEPEEPVVQKPIAEFSLPEYVYAGSSLDVTAAIKNATSVTWTISADGNEVDSSTFSAEGGNITFDVEGMYTFTVVAENSAGIASCEQSVQVIPVASIGVALPEYGHTDEDFDVKLLLEDVENAAEIHWSVIHDGEEVELPADLGNTGGTVNLGLPGEYTFRASYTDKLGNEYSDEKTIRILPIVTLEITATPDTTYVDVATDIIANDNELPVQWTLYRDGEALEWDSVTESVLADDGGKLLLLIPGEYQLQASITDESGRVFVSNEENITILGLLEPELSAPEITWVDESTTITLQGIGDNEVKWELRDAEGLPFEYTGDLGAEGGEILIEQVGEYTLIATVTDSNGREFTVSTVISVLPDTVYQLDVDKQTVHVGDAIALMLHEPRSVDGYETSWNVSLDGESYEGLPLEDLSSVVLDEVGIFTINAVMTDAAGREFETNAVEIKVLPYAEIEAIADKTTMYEGKSVTITTNLSVEDYENVHYLLERDGEVFETGLTGNGGELVIEAAGEYFLTAVYTDELGYEVFSSVNLTVLETVDLAITAPDTVHVGEIANIDLVVEGSIDGEITWRVISDDGEETAVNLGATGGTITFDSSGVYVLEATVADADGEEHKAIASIDVWDNVQLSFKLPKFTHTDETVLLKMTSENLGSNVVEWSLTVDGSEVSNGVQGELTNDGGAVKFTEVGENVLTATVIDDAGKEFTYSQTIQVYPVINLAVDTAKATHTDKTFDVGLVYDANVSGIAWSVASANAATTDVVYVGQLTDEGGSIQIAEAGVYDIVASVIDETGRIFKSPAATIQVYPVAGISFVLPATAYTDTHTPINLLSTDLPEIPVTWSLKKGGTEASLATYMYGELGDKGGTVRFPEVGLYELTATATDDLGREYSWSQEIEIYPVVGISMGADEIGYTDRPVDITVATENRGSYPVVWKMYLNGEEKNPAAGLGVTGGHLNLEEPGLYTFVASVTDELGRESIATGSVQVYPVGGAAFYIPAMFHTDEEVDVVTNFTNLEDNALQWTLTRNGERVSVNDYFSDSPTADGVKTFVRKAGDYVLKSTFVDGGGRVYSHEQKFTVYPIPDVAWTLPTYAHTDTVIDVPVEASNVLSVEGSEITWFIDDTYGLRQNWDTYVDGTLADSKGTIRIKHAGIYTIGCEVKDATGRVFTFDGPSIEVLPELEVGVSITEDNVYTGDDVQVRTLGNNIEIPVIWKLKKDGKPVDIEKYMTGELNSYGGTVRFTQGGTYELVGILTDALGRSFESSDTISVVPRSSLDFSMSSMEYVGHTVTIVMDELYNPLNKDVQWTIKKDGVPIDIDLSNLTNHGGTVVFPEVGMYTVTATLRDDNGKTVIAEHEIDVVYRATLEISAPSSVHIGDKFAVSLAGNGSLPVEWGMKLGKHPVIFDGTTGFLTDIGGDLTLYKEGVYTLTATVKDKAGNYQTGFKDITITNNAPIVTKFTATSTRTLKDGKYYAELNAECEDPDGDAVHLEWDNEYREDGWYDIGDHIVRVRAVDEWGAASAWESRTVEFINSAPVIDTFTVRATKQLNGNKYFAEVTATASDPDGDAVIIEWGGDYVEDGYYDRSKVSTIKVRAVDEYGAASDWVTKTVEYVNEPPSAPSLEIVSSGRLVLPSKQITFKASSYDPDGDPITYEWTGWSGSPQSYSRGTHTVSCRAKDSHGNYSPTSTITFVVIDGVTGGLVLKSANSTIDVPLSRLGNVTWYFDVPAVSGHGGSDYGLVEGFDGSSWVQVSKQTTSNGVFMQGSFSAGKYTQLRFSYYTNHNCMYNKSNISYAIVYD